MARHDLSPVWFSKDQFRLWKEISDLQFTSLKFKDFCKSAFHEKVDRIRQEIKIFHESKRKKKALSVVPQKQLTHNI